MLILQYTLEAAHSHHLWCSSVGFRSEKPTPAGRAKPQPPVIDPALYAPISHTLVDDDDVHKTPM